MKPDEETKELDRTLLLVILGLATAIAAGSGDLIAAGAFFLLGLALILL